jgi:hypothetical protein
MKLSTMNVRAGIFLPREKLVLTPHGEAKVIGQNLVKKTVLVDLLEICRQEEFPIEEIEKLPPCKGK